MKILLLFAFYLIGFSSLAQLDSDYSRFWSFSNGLARAEKNGLIGFIDTSFNEVIPFEFHWVNNFYENGHGLASFTDSSKIFGFINRQGEMVVEPKYEMVYYFEDSVNLIYVFDGRHYGWMNQFGVEVIPCTLEQTVSTPEHFHSGKVRVKKDGSYGEMDQFGNTTIACKYSWIDGFDNTLGFPKTGLIPVRGTNKKDYFYLNRDTGEEIHLDYDYVGEFIDGFAMVSKNGLHGYINESLELVIPCTFKNARHFSCGRAPVSNDEKKWGVIDTTGKLILDYTYDFIEEFYDDRALVRINGIEDFSEGRMFPFRVEDRFGYIDVNGKKLTQVEYEGTSFGSKPNADYPHLVLKKDGECTLVNKQFKRVSRKKYTSIAFSNIYYLNADILIDKDSNYCLGNRNGLFYPINRRGKEMTKHGSKRMFFFEEGVSMYQDTNGLCGFINYDGDITIPAEYTYSSYGYFNNGTVVMDKMGKRGIIDKKGEIVVPFIYDYLQNFEDGFALGKRDGHYFFINRNGEEAVRTQGNE